MRIMIVGDSITIGSAGDFTWRYRLWQHLGAALGPSAFHFVGPRTGLYDPADGGDGSQSYADPAFPEDARRHLAGWGEGWLHMAPVIRDEVRRSAADTLLVCLGLIDLGFYTDPAQTEVNVRRFLAEARAADPGVRMVLMPVLPNIRAHLEPPFMAQVQDLNARIATTAAELSTPSSPLVLATPPPAWAPATDTHDGTHPNAHGEHRIAAAFAEALHITWHLGGPYATAATSHPG